MMKLSLPGVEPDLQPHIVVFGVGGAGGNAVNNMIQADLEGVEFVVANTDAQALRGSLTQRRLQLGTTVTRGLGAGARPDVGRAAAEEQVPDIIRHLQGANMAFITAGMGGGTGTGAAPVIARIAREQGILTIGVVTKPFHFEGAHRMRLAEAGIAELQQYVDTLIIIPNQNLFRIANQKTTFADAFKLADDVLHTGVRGVTDLMVLPGLINLDFADIRSVMTEMGQAMMGTGEASGERRALEAAEAAISNPLLSDVAMKGARGVLINITGGVDMTLFEIDEAANRIRDEVDPDANIIFGSTFDPMLDGRMRVSMVATGIDAEAVKQHRIPQTDLRNAPGRARQAPAIPGVMSGPSARAGAVAQPAPVPPGRIPPAPVLSGLVHPIYPTVLPAGGSASQFAAPAQSPLEERRHVTGARPDIPQPPVVERVANAPSQSDGQEARFMPPVPLTVGLRPTGPALHTECFVAPAPITPPAKAPETPVFQRIVGGERHMEADSLEQQEDPTVMRAANQPEEPAIAALTVQPVSSESEDLDLMDIPASLRRHS